MMLLKDLDSSVKQEEDFLRTPIPTSYLLDNDNE